MLSILTRRKIRKRRYVGVVVESIIPQRDVPPLNITGSVVHQELGETSTTQSTIPREEHSAYCALCNGTDHTADACSIIQLGETSTTQSTISRAFHCALCGGTDHNADGCYDTLVLSMTDSTKTDDNDARSDHHGVTPNANHHPTSFLMNQDQSLRSLACLDVLRYGTCPRGLSCPSSHAVQWLGTTNASSQSQHEQRHPISSIAIWPSVADTINETKVFTGGSDGCWRLWTTSTNAGSFFQNQFEANMSGRIRCLAVVITIVSFVVSNSQRKE